MVKNNHPLGYRMTRKMFNSILENRTDEDKKANPYVFVMNYLNEQNGLRGTVRNISIQED